MVILNKKGCYKLEKKILISLIILFGFFSSVYAFDFYGYTYYANGSAVNATNITINIYEIGQFGLTLNSSYSDLSNESGYFNVSGVPEYQSQNMMYKILIRHYNDSSNLYVDYIGASLPELPAQALIGLTESELKFYLKEAATINISAVNATGSPVNFSYQLKDVALGYPIAEDLGETASNSNILLYVPKNRNYSIMLYPNQDFPVSKDITTSNLSSGYFSYTFNMTTSMQRLTGYLGVDGTNGGFSSMAVTMLLLEPGRMIYFGEDSVAVYNFTGTDFYNLTSGFYNITVPGPVEGGSLIVFAVANKSGNLYGAYKEISLSYGSDPAATNLSLVRFVGSDGVMGVMTATGDVNLSVGRLRFNLLNESGGTYGDFAHVEMQIDYDDYNMTNFTFMLDVSNSDNGVFSVPLLNISGVDRINVFTQQAAPKKDSLDLSEINVNEVNITLKDAFNMEDPDGDSLGNLFVDMVKNSAECDVPYYNASACSLFGGNEQNASDVDPFSVVLSGAPISFRMKNENNITVHYVNVDLLASGPPDAIFDSDSSDQSESSVFEQAWRFGSTGPEIYDYVIIGVPYTEGSTSVTGFNESLDINITIDFLYGGENFDVIWNSSAGDNVSDILNNNSLKDYRDYVGNEYEVYLNGTQVTCNESDVNLTGLCYKDINGNMLWFKIPHFSGVGPVPKGSLITASSSNNNNDNPGGGSTDDTTTSSNSEGCTNGDNYCSGDVLKECVDGSWEEVKTCAYGCSDGACLLPSFSWDSLSADEEVSVDVLETSALKEIKFKVNSNVNDAKLEVSELNELPEGVESLNESVYKYFNISSSIENRFFDYVEIRFSVDSDWADGKDIVLRRYDGNWSDLNTSLVNGSEYVAISPGFSYFAVVGRESGLGGVTGGVVDETVEKQIESWQIIVLVVTLLVIIGLVYWRHFYKKN